MSEYYMSHSGGELDEAISKVKNGYILPSGPFDITANGEYDVTEFAKALVNVEGQYYASSLNPSADTHNASFNVGFEPKLFVIVSVNTVNATNGIYYIAAFWHCADLTGTGSGQYSGGLTAAPGSTAAYDARSYYSYSDGIVKINDAVHYFKSGTLYRIFGMT